MRNQFSDLFNQFSVCTCIVGLNGQIILANRAMCASVVYEEAELMQMSIFDLLADADRRKEFSDLFMMGNSFFNFEADLRSKSEAVINVQISSGIMKINETVSFLVSFIDITSFKFIQQCLFKAKEQYFRLFNNVPVGITVTDTSGSLISFNQAIVELVGYPEDDLKSINAAEFYIDKSDRQSLLALVSSKGSVRDFETKFKHRNGDAIPVLINTELVEIDGKSNILLNSIRDIRKVKKLEELAIGERDFSNAILEIAASLILVIDRDGRISRFNRYCEKTTGYTSREVVGQYIWDVLTVNPELTKKVTLGHLSGFSPGTHENIWKSKSGSNRLISWSSTELMDAEGKVEHIIATGIDITDYRQAEIDLHESNQKLAVWVKELEERTSEMNQLSELGDQLQNCQNTAETCSISAQYIRLLFPSSHGAIYLINPSRDLAESVESWGDAAFSAPIFLPSNCWAVRRGRLHLIDSSHPGLRCSHAAGSEADLYLCVPLIAHGEILGIIYLKYDGGQAGLANAPSPALSEQKKRVAMELAEHIALALSNMRLRDALRQQSIRDILTGLFNRRYMEETLIREIRRAERENKPIGLILFDIDHFKEFNDLSGHDAGDALLKELGSYLRNNLREGDIVCRYGGEEFVAVLPNADLETTRLRAEMFRAGVKGLMVYHLGKPLGKCSISLGVSAFPEHGVSGESLLKCADDALYAAKREGRDRVVVAAAGNIV